MSAAGDNRFAADPRGLVVFGGGGHALVVAESAAAAGWDVIGFVDENENTGECVDELSHWRRLPLGTLEKTEAGVIVAVGDNAARKRIIERLVQAGRRMATVVAPSAVVSVSSTIGQGVYIGAQAVVNGQARIGDGAIINTGAIIEHHNVIGAYAHVAPRVALAGRVEVGPLTLVGIGACARPSVKIGAHCTVGAGAVVVHDVPDHTTVVGVPARGR